MPIRTAVSDGRTANRRFRRAGACRHSLLLKPFKKMERRFSAPMTYINYRDYIIFHQHSCLNTTAGHVLSFYQ